MTVIEDMEMMECPRCKGKIYAHSVRDCYYDYMYCPKCGKVKIEKKQSSESKHNGISATIPVRVINTTIYQYADGETIEQKEVLLYEKNANPV